MEKRESALRCYYRTIRNYLPCSHKLKNRILDRIQTNISGYLSEKPDADYTQIEAHFGKPQDIAAAYIDDMDAPELLHTLRIRRRVFTSFVIGIIAALIIWGVCVGFAYIESVKTSNGSGKSFIEEVYESTERLGGIYE